VGAGGGSFTADTLAQVAKAQMRTVMLDGVGHHAALEAPHDVAEAILDFTASVDAA
jgi:pimeloyl-ACP methyl ester carboxylesterase